MSMKVTSVRIAGIGGMGVLKSSLILAEACFRHGFDVKKAEVHGMSQRGGSLCSDVRFGGHIFSPMIPSGEIDYLLLFRDEELPLHEADCSDNTVIIKASGMEIGRLRDKRSLNVAMLGSLSRHLDIPYQIWIDVIHDVFPGRTHAGNEQAFDLGREETGGEP